MVWAQSQSGSKMMTLILKLCSYCQCGIEGNLTPPDTQSHSKYKHGNCLLSYWTVDGSFWSLWVILPFHVFNWNSQQKELYLDLFSMTVLILFYESIIWHITKSEHMLHILFKHHVAQGKIHLHRNKERSKCWFTWYQQNNNLKKKLLI